jgi:ABC-2 type transport system ATP-binding protein
MKQGGKGVFFSTHITSDLDKVADMLILINDGEILFECGKDSLIETHRLIKGDSKSLNGDSAKLFLKIRVTDFGFTEITNRVSEVMGSMHNILTEKPTIEDIMLAYVEGGNAE